MKKSDFYLEVQKTYTEAVDKNVKEQISIINQKILNAAKEAYCEVCINTNSYNEIKELANHYRNQGFSTFWDEDGCGGWFLEITWRKKK